MMTQGTKKLPYAPIQGNLVPDGIRAILQDQEIKIVCPEPQADGGSVFTAGAEMVLSGYADAMVVHLPEVPAIRPGALGDLAITALSARYSPVQGLEIHPDSLDMNQDLRLKAGSKIYVPSDADGIQLSCINPDITWQVCQPQETGSDLLPRFISASQGFTDLNLSEGSQFISVNVKEVIPEPGSGYWAFIARREDFRVRKVLKKFHHPEELVISNAERTIKLGNYADRIKVHVTRDKKGFFHVYAFDTHPSNPQKISFSTSIASQITDLLITKFTKT